MISTEFNSQISFLYVKESEILEWLELDILPPILQPWLQPTICGPLS